MRRHLPGRSVVYLLGAMMVVAASACSQARTMSESSTGGGASAQCNGCHGDATSPAPPKALGGETATTAIGVGAHRSHLVDGAIRQAIACSECHVVPAAIDSPGHLGTPPAPLTFGPLAQARGATPSWSHETATCSGVYCHGAKTSGGSLTAPLWTRVDGTQAACGTCHGAPPAASTGHPVVTGGLTACATCHPGTVRGDGSIDVAGGLHIDGKVDVTSAHPAGWMDAASGSFHGDAAKAGLATCQSCHGAALDGTGGSATTSCATCHGTSWSTSCTMCHGGAVDRTGAPPVDIRDRTATTEVTVGAHAAHVAGGALAPALDCDACHVKPADAFAPGHLGTGPAPLAWGPLARAAGAQPAWDRTSATCSNVYCHGATLAGGTRVAPVWTQVGTGQASCGSCHGLPPPTSSGHPAVSGGLTACVGCHPQTVDAAGNVIPPASGGRHLDGIVESTSGHVTGWLDPASPSFHGNAAKASLASCQVCHGQALDGVGGTATTSCNTCHSGWRTNCTFCHGDKAAGPSGRSSPPVDTRGGSATTSISVGAHTAHVLGSNALSATMDCTACHVKPTDALSAGHVNGTAAVAFSPLASTGGVNPAWNRTGATCSNVYCHGATLTGGGQTTPVWTTVNGSQSACTSCHGAPPPSPHPQRADLDCSSCHAGYSLASRTVDRALHVNGTVEATVGCTSCHGDVTRTATAASPLHAAPPTGTRGETAATTRAVGAHQRHLVAGPSGAAVACTECHVVPATTTHANGTVEIAWGTLARTGGAAPAWNGTTCASSYCHGNFTNGNQGYAPSWTAPAATACGTCHGLPPAGTHPTNAAACGSCHGGYTASTVNAATHLNGVVDVTGMGCTSCHGNAAQTATQASPLYAAPPTGTHGETATTTRAVGAHQRHLVAGAIRSAVACTECHVVPASNTHSTGAVEVTWGTLARTGGVTPTWNGTTCASSYCHGNFTNGNRSYAPSWTVPAATTCGTCHGLPPAGTHPANAAACGSCHTGYTASTVNLATHMNGTVDVAAMTCTSCHGTAGQPATQASPLYAAPPLGTRGETATTARAVGAHQAHLTGTRWRSTPVACTDCHAVPASTSHATGTVDMTWGTLARTGSFTPTWNGTALTCTNYCHGSSLGAGGTNTAPSWTGGAGQAACGTCHGAPPPSPHTTSTDCGSCHAGYTASSVNPATHMNGTLEVTSNHPAGWADRTQHGYQANLTGLAGCKACHGTDLAGGTSGVSCTACHTTAGFATWATNCTFCHGDRNSGRQSPPVDVQGRSATTNTSVGRHDRHVTTTLMATIGCVQCHPARSTSVITDTAHVDGNGVAEVTLATIGGMAGSYSRANATSATCTTYCHSDGQGTATTPSWTSATAMTCTSCHGAPPATGEHAKHMSKSLNCSHCHSGIATGTGNTATNATIVSGSLHVNGTRNVVFGGTYNGTTVSMTTSVTGTSRTCSGSCHGSKTW